MCTTTKETPNLQWPQLPRRSRGMGWSPVTGVTHPMSGFPCWFSLVLFHLRAVLCSSGGWAEVLLWNSHSAASSFHEHPTRQRWVCKDCSVLLPQSELFLDTNSMLFMMVDVWWKAISGFSGWLTCQHCRSKKQTQMWDLNSLLA